MLKSIFRILLTCLLSFNAYAEPLENQFSPPYQPYTQQTALAQDQPYPYSPLPTQVYPNSVQTEDYYPYGPKSSQLYVSNGYTNPSPRQSAGCGCHGGGGRY